MEESLPPARAGASAWRWLPYLGGAAGAIAVLFLWMALANREEIVVREQVDVALNAAQKQLTSQVANIDRTLRRVARFAAQDPSAPAWQQSIPAFERDAEDGRNG